jgi:hypothetical protein
MTELALDISKRSVKFELRAGADPFQATTLVPSSRTLHRVPKANSSVSGPQWLRLSSPI